MIPRPDPTSQTPLAANRVRGAIRASFAPVGARTEIAALYETGGYRLRLPRSRTPACEAVIVNTGGGMAGGDRIALSFSCGEAATATLTTVSAEKLYRSGDRSEARVDVDLTLSRGARLAWLPQETILFDGARLRRRLLVDMAPDSDLLLAEMLVFGRLSAGERLGAGLLQDRWRVRRGGRLALAEDLLLSGELGNLLDRPALGCGARACVTLALVASRAEALLASVRDLLDAEAVVGGASAWNGLLMVRAASPSPARLRTAIVAVVSVLLGHPLPRLWT